MAELAGTGAPNERHPGFTCFKTYSPIRYDRRWYRLALVKAALDPEIRRMGPCPVGIDKLPTTAEFAFWASTQRGSRLIILTSSDVDTAAVSARMPVQIQHRFELSRGAAAAFEKAIWSCKRRAVLPVEQLCAAGIFRDKPEGTEMGAIMSTLAAKNCIPIGDTVEAIFAMIANGILETDVSFGLSPYAIVRPGPMMGQTGLLPATRQVGNAQLDLFSEQVDPGTSMAF